VRPKQSERRSAVDRAFGRAKHKLVPHGRGARDGQLVPQLLKSVLRERAFAEPEQASIAFPKVAPGKGGIAVISVFEPASSTVTKRAGWPPADDHTGAVYTCRPFTAASSAGGSARLTESPAAWGTHEL
jgi:hypothetical protein